MSDEIRVESHLVANRNQTISFTGARLAFVTAARPYAPRWAELELFRVWDRSGSRPCSPPEPSFVFTRVGHSRVYHAGTCQAAPSRLPFGHEVAAIDVAGLIPCPSCSPDPPPGPAAAGHDFLTMHRFEITRYRAVVCSDVASLAGELSPPDRQSASPPVSLDELPWLSARLVSAAAHYDEYLARTFGVQVARSQPNAPESHPRLDPADAFALVASAGRR